MVKVSIIVPIYNVEKYLNRCLESIINQTLPEIEIICINDGSKDNSLAILEEYALKDNRIKVINMPQNKGQSVARNKGLEIATGEYIMFVDSDDYIHPQSAEIMYSLTKKNNLDVLATINANYLDKLKKDYFPTYNIQNIKLIPHKSPLREVLNNSKLNSVVWNKIYKRELIQNTPFTEGIYYEDWSWVLCIFANIKRYMTIEEPLYYYNTINTSTTRSTFTSKKIKDFATSIRDVAKCYQKQKDKHLWRKIQKQKISKIIKMMLNHTYKQNKITPSKELVTTLINEIQALYKENLFFYRDIPLRPLVRFLELKTRHKRSRYAEQS